MLWFQVLVGFCSLASFFLLANLEYVLYFIFNVDALAPLNFYAGSLVKISMFVLFYIVNPVLLILAFFHYKKKINLYYFFHVVVFPFLISGAFSLFISGVVLNNLDLPGHIVDYSQLKPVAALHVRKTELNTGSDRIISDKARIDELFGIISSYKYRWVGDFCDEKNLYYVYFYNENNLIDFDNKLGYFSLREDKIVTPPYHSLFILNRYPLFCLTYIPGPESMLKIKNLLETGGS